MMWIIIYGTKEQKWNLWNRVDIEKVPRDERVGTGLLNLIIYQTDIVTVVEKEESFNSTEKYTAEIVFVLLSFRCALSSLREIMWVTGMEMVHHVQLLFIWKQRVKT